MFLEMQRHGFLVVFAAAVAATWGCGGPQQIDPAKQLLKDLREGDSAAKIAAASQIPTLGGPSGEIAEALFNLLQNDSDPKVRAAAARGLRGVGQGSINRLIGIFNTEQDKTVKYEIEQIITAVGGGPREAGS